MARLLRTPLRLLQASGSPASILCRRVYSSPAAPPPPDALPPSNKANPSPTILLRLTDPVDSAPELLVDPDEGSATNTESLESPESVEYSLRSPGEVEYEDSRYTITRTKKGLVIAEDSKGPLQITDATLRDSCKCPTCVDPHSKQRNFRLSDISPDLECLSPKIVNGKLHVVWKHDIFEGSPVSIHHSEYDLDQLRYPVINRREAEAAGKFRWRAFWDNARMEHWQHWITFEQFMNDEVAFTWSMRTLAELGLIFIKDIPDSREMVEKIATRMGPIRNTFYGSTWDVRSVAEAKNVAYTNQFLGFHMDLMYMNDPPGYQLLHCLQNSCEGGESLFVDTFRAAYDMRKHHPGYYSHLCKTNLAYEYNHEDHFYTNEWPVFQTERPRKPVRGHATHQASENYQLTHVNYSPPFQAPLRNMHPLHFRTLARALNTFTKYLDDEKYQFELKMKPGECVIFENRRVAHARRAFQTDSGQRWLAGAYVDEDAMLSLFKTSANKYPALWKYQRKGLNSRHVRLLRGSMEDSS
ncbi:putative Gamma-butyrobetaine hydroxylase subfamily [Aspergillus ibericus CBS 121593]|uniref:Clavaminate synthase-like protein n=1 Tax=Aspergillus ibericus CBS 121593 TaxID=1448316 RepID=A0A395H481_9EURO|nr:Clavaminate synthase-like protein [Aspergillus ibericus CBS 121593]RAL02259.1 Clavaminate synthase-like protein [Aspergillus ibericus CBS 121593]